MREDEKRAILRHVEEVASALRGKPVLARILRALASAVLDRVGLSGWELTERIYGNTDDASYHALKANVSRLRRALRKYYAELPREPALRLTIPTGAFGLQFDARARNQMLWRRWPALSMAVLLLLVAVGGLAGWAVVRPGMPATVVLDKGRSRLLDARGREIRSWRPLLRPEEGGQGTVFPAGRAQTTVRATVLTKRDGTPRVAIARGSRDHPGRGTLTLYDGTSQAVLDVFPLPYFADGTSPRLLHLNEEGTVPSQFEVISCEARAFDDGQRGVLLVIKLFNLYPTQILALSVRNERWVVRRSYWFAGSSVVHRVEDLNGDGRSELIIGGTNNDYQQATLAILELDEPDGRTPLGPRRKIFREIADLPENGTVIRFPRTVVSESPRYGTLRSVLRRLKGPFPGRIIVEDVATDEDERHVTFDLSGPAFLVRFDAYDFYQRELKKLIDENSVVDAWRIMKTDRLDGYANALAGEILYWDGSSQSAEWKVLTPAKLRTLRHRLPQVRP